MKKTIAVLMGVVLLYLSIYAKPQPPETLWTHTYGGNYQEGGFCVQQTSDAGFIIVGYTTSYGAGTTDVYLIKTDSNGDTLWTRTYGSNIFEDGYCVQQTTDGGYIIAGRTGYWTGYGDVYLVKTDANGDTIWTRKIGGSLFDSGNSVQQTYDEGYIIAGGTSSYGAGAYDVYLIKVNATGDTVWTKTYGGIEYDIGRSVKITYPDSGYIIAGSSNSFSYHNDVYLIRTNANGDTIWTRTYGTSSEDEYGYCIQQTTDGGYIIVGNKGTYWTYRIYLIKTDSEGDTLWTRIYNYGSCTYYGNSIQQTTDGGYIIVGYADSYSWQDTDVFLMKINAVGDTLWTKHYSGGSNLYDEGNSVQQTSDGGYIVVGFTEEGFFADLYDVFLIRLGPEEVLVEGFGTYHPTEFALHAPHPNPFNPTTTLSYDLPEGGEVSLVIFDIQGREAARLVDGWHSAGVYEKIWHAAGMPSGIYFARLQANEFSQTRKLLLIK